MLLHIRREQRDVSYLWSILRRRREGYFAEVAAFTNSCAVTTVAWVGRILSVSTR